MVYFLRKGELFVNNKKECINMTKDLIAYFKSESNAERARAGLQRIRVENLYVDEMPEQDGSKEFMPIMGSDQQHLADGLGGFNAEQASALQSIEGEDVLNIDDGQPVTHMIHGKVEDDDYVEALTIIHKAHGFLEKV